jgi:hypothetical protein
MYPSISLLVGLAASASAATIVVNAGENGFTYTPDTLIANVGDTVEFHFFTNFHTAVQGDFDTPCAPGSLSATGFDSGPTTNVCPIFCFLSSALIVVNMCSLLGRAMSSQSRSRTPIQSGSIASHQLIARAEWWELSTLLPLVTL